MTIRLTFVYTGNFVCSLDNNSLSLPPENHQPGPSPPSIRISSGALSQPSKDRVKRQLITVNHNSIIYEAINSFKVPPPITIGPPNSAPRRTAPQNKGLPCCNIFKRAQLGRVGGQGETKHFVGQERATLGTSVDRLASDHGDGRSADAVTVLVHEVHKRS